MPRKDGTSMDEPLDRKTRPAHASVSGRDIVHKIAVQTIAIGPDMSQNTPRAKISLTRSFSFQKRCDTNSCGTFSGDGKESIRIARLTKEQCGITRHDSRGGEAVESDA